MTLGDILMAGCAACVWGYHICMRICAIVCPGITAVATGAADPSVQTVREIRIDEDAEKRRALGGRGGATALGLICRWLNLLHQISRVGVAIQAHTVFTAGLGRLLMRIRHAHRPTKHDQYCDNERSNSGAHVASHNQRWECLHAPVKERLFYVVYAPLSTCANGL